MKQTAPANFHEQTRGAKKILVVDLGFLGDSLHLVPALWEIKRHHPAAPLHVLSAPLGREVLRLAPCVDRAWAVELDPARRSWREQIGVLRALRGERFDLAFNFGGNDRPVIWTALSGARWRVAHAAGRKHFWNRWLIPHWVPRQDPDVTVFEQRRRVLAACGFKLEPPRFDLRVDDASRSWAEGVVPAGAIHLSINSANPLKEWPLEHHATLLGNLFSQFPDLRVVASAGAKPREKERLQTLAAAVNDPRLQRLPENLSIAQLAAVLSRCRLHLGPDSGVMHLAVALGIPAISFFRAQGGYRSWLPVGSEHRNVIAPCDCVDHTNTPCDLAQRAACLERISPGQVAAIVIERIGLAAGSVSA